MSIYNINPHQHINSTKTIVIAVIEDDADDREFICNALCESDKIIKIHTYLNGGDFLSELSIANLPDLILTDIRMPLVTGFDVLKSVKGNPKLTHIPVIILSTSGNTEDIELAKDLGATAYYTKPYALQDYCTIVTNIIVNLRDHGLFGAEKFSKFRIAFQKYFRKYTFFPFSISDC